MLIRASGVSYRYGQASPALSDVDLELASGEIVALLGSNGAGKSTLLRILLGELTATAGTVVRVPVRTEAGRIAVGYAGEEIAHFDALTGLDNARFFARAAGLGADEATSAVGELMRVLGLDTEADDAVSTYSFGARRKLLLVEALAHRPPLLLLDEPTVGLDAGSREALTRLLRQRREDGSGVVLASHDLQFLDELVDRIVFVHEGRAVTAGRPEELLATLGTATRFEITLEATPDRLPEHFGEAVTLVDDGDPLVFETSRGQSALPDVWGALVSAGARISSVDVREPGLAELFRRLTGAELDE